MMLQCGLTVNICLVFGGRKLIKLKNVSIAHYILVCSSVSIDPYFGVFVGPYRSLHIFYFIQPHSLKINQKHPLSITRNYSQLKILLEPNATISNRILYDRTDMMTSVCDPTKLENRNKSYNYNIFHI